LPRGRPKRRPRRRRLLNRLPSGGSAFHPQADDLPATEALLTNWEGIVASQSSNGLRESLILCPLNRTDYELPTFECVYYRNDSGAYFPKYETGSRLKVQGVLEPEWSPSNFRPMNAKTITRDLGDIFSGSKASLAVQVSVAASPGGVFAGADGGYGLGFAAATPRCQSNLRSEPCGHKRRPPTVPRASSSPT